MCETRVRERFPGTSFSKLHSRIKSQLGRNEFKNRQFTVFILYEYGKSFMSESEMSGELLLKYANNVKPVVLRDVFTSVIRIDNFCENFKSNRFSVFIMSQSLFRRATSDSTPGNDGKLK